MEVNKYAMLRLEERNPITEVSRYAIAQFPGLEPVHGGE